MYTAAQQAQLDAAKASLDAAKAAFSSAETAANAAYSALNNCVCGKGKVNGKCRPLESIVEFPNKQIGICRSPAPLDRCKTDCCSLSTCQARRTTYNDSITTYQTAQSALASAQTNYDTVLNQITIEIENDPQTQVDIATAQADAQATGQTLTTRWLIFGIIAVVLIVGIGIIYFKFIKK